MADEAKGSALNVKLDMQHVSAVLEQQPRMHVSLPSARGDLTILEATRTLRTVGGSEVEDNQVNVLC